MTSVAFRRAAVLVPALALASAVLLTSGGISLAGGKDGVRSLLESRQQNVVVQQWDLSCGAAALTTILRYQHGETITEKEVAIGLLTREEYLANPELVRLRRGFSLLDLKRFVEQRGYKGVGLGQLTLDDLNGFAPIIVPIDARGYKHFVVYRGIYGNRVLLADPAFGNRTMLRSTFEDAWIDYPQIGRVGFYVGRKDGRVPANQLSPKQNEFVTLR